MQSNGTESQCHGEKALGSHQVSNGKSASYSLPR